jgi:catechol 2,3-dioxygenase-like lactoylglutathione lyase family enzyme
MAPKFSAISLVVADMGKSLAFYRRLGLDLPDNADSEPHVDITLPGGARLMWDTIGTIHSFDPDWTPPSGGARAALAFECADPGEVDRVFADLVGAGYEGHKPPWDAFWGQRYATMRDPDGNGVDLYAGLS